MSGETNFKRGYYNDNLCKKESKGKWTSYWVVLDGRYLKFYEENEREKLIGSVEIGGKTKCVISKRKNYSFPFLLFGAHGRHLLKCESSFRRHRWMTAISQAVELLRLPASQAQESDPKVCDTEDEAKDYDEDNESEEESLPQNVLLVSSLPNARVSPTLPFKLQNRERAFSEDHDERTSNEKSKTVVYPFAQNIGQSVPQISKANLLQGSSSFDSGNFIPSPRGVRSFPTTPEKSATKAKGSPLTLDASCFGMSRSLSSLTSSRMDMRFSRHMVSGSQSGDTEV